MALLVARRARPTGLAGSDGVSAGRQRRGAGRAELTTVCGIDATEMSDQATYYGANGWLLELRTTHPRRPMVDRPLVFPPGAWLLKGELPQDQPVPEDPICSCSPKGCRTTAIPTPCGAGQKRPRWGSRCRECVERLGFQRINTLRPGETHRVGDLSVRATAGAAVPMVENGYLWICQVARCIWSPMECSILSCCLERSTP